MDSSLRLTLHNLEVSEAEINRLRNKALGNGVSEQEARALGDRITHIRQAAKIADLLFGEGVKEISSYDRYSGKVKVLMKGGFFETFQL